MFQSIKWRFTLIFFILIFIAMIISGTFIVGNLQKNQVKMLVKNMEIFSKTLVSSSSSLAEEDWERNKSNIQKTIDERRIANNEAVYVISMKGEPTIVASSVKGLKEGSVYSFRMIDVSLLESVNDGEIKTVEILDPNTERLFQHLANPVFSNAGELKGIIYMTSDLSDMYIGLENAITTIVTGTLIALGVTLFLGFMIARSITEPIQDVTEKAEKMAQGDFNQYVEVKSTDEIGQLSTMFNFLTEKLKDTMEEMALEKSKLDAIFEYMTEGVAAIDLDGVIIHVNPVAVDILGYDSQEELVGRNFPKAIFDTNRYFLEDKNDGREEHLINIEKKVYKIKYQIFKNEYNAAFGFIIVFQDLTREHNLDENRKEFVANVSHELKTPLTTVKTYTETLLDMDVDRETREKFLGVIDKETDRMTNLVRDLLDLSNIDYNKSIWKKAYSSLESVIEEVIKKLDYSASLKRQEIVFNREDLPEIEMDRGAIERVLINIISNSIKYTEDQGRIEINLSRRDDEAVIVVKDNGIGIPEEDLSRVFERFYRVEKGRSREMGGTGLGLSIAKEIVEGHGGRIDMESDFGKGTQTRIILPL
ncbi:MAG: cell wall metabolism sensor histidine kinase WalK [Tissierellia bacterium]|nr:cell wall metabolism sensor histidine kinase WalK [Tissierellia bacterium]